MTSKKQRTVRIISNIGGFSQVTMLLKGESDVTMMFDSNGSLHIMQYILSNTCRLCVTMISGGSIIAKSKIRHSKPRTITVDQRQLNMLLTKAKEHGTKSTLKMEVGDEVIRMLIFDTESTHMGTLSCRLKENGDVIKVDNEEKKTPDEAFLHIPPELSFELCIPISADTMYRTISAKIETTVSVGNTRVKSSRDSVPCLMFSGKKDDCVVSLNIPIRTPSIAKRVQDSDLGELVFMPTCVSMIRKVLHAIQSNARHMSQQNPNKRKQPSSNNEDDVDQMQPASASLMLSELRLDKEMPLVISGILDHVGSRITLYACSKVVLDEDPEDDGNGTITDSSDDEDDT